MPDVMFFSEDSRSLRRGKRESPRTDTCRPCLVWVKDAPGAKMRGVVMDASPHGMRIRMIEILPTATPIMVQLMRDDDFQVPLSLPTEGSVVRYAGGAGGFTDHGVQLVRKALERIEPRPVNIPRRPPARLSGRTRMYTIDYTVGGRRRAP